MTAPFSPLHRAGIALECAPAPLRRRATPRTRGLTTGDGLAFAVGLSLAIIGGGAAWLVSDHQAANDPPCRAAVGRWQGEALTEGPQRPIAP